ncbi:MAG: carbon storage regulator CsrA [Clostridiales bacterium]|nr:carbon storage regulator CsrA [Clostridiales bacterium]
MLVLTRKQNEGILIGQDILVTVVSIDGDKVRVGIEAPRNVRVIREELTAEIGQENQMAARSAYFPLCRKEQDET